MEANKIEGESLNRQGDGSKQREHRDEPLILMHPLGTKGSSPEGVRIGNNVEGKSYTHTQSLNHQSSAACN